MTTTKPQLLTPDDLMRLHSEGVRGELIMGGCTRRRQADWNTEKLC